MGRGTGPDWRGRVTAAACSCVRGGSGTTLTVIRAAVYTSTALAGGFAGVTDRWMLIQAWLVFDTR